MATIGDVRKTSNGCSAAKRISRIKAGFRVPSNNVAAIDFGTTNCSVAYTVVGDSSEKGPHLLPLNNNFSRVPTAILFSSDGSIKAFGYDARTEYINLDAHERLQCAYFEQIKMNLQHDETVNREMKIRAQNGRQYYLVDVIAQILKYLKIELIENYLKRGGHQLEATDFDWVITVPAIWRARGKQMMREAGYKAGLCSQETCGNLQVASLLSSNKPDEAAPDKLSLALEPESAAIYCQSMSQQQLAAYCDADKPYTSQCYLLVDVGGGTVDITAHTVATRDQIKVVQPPTGNDCGGSQVNKHFKIFLENLVDDEEFTAFTSTGDAENDAKNRALIGELVNEKFEKQKTFFGSKMKKGSEGKQFSIRLPYEFIETYKDALEEGIQDAGDSRVRLAAGGQELRITYSKMEEFFQPVISGILECISEALNEVEGKIETVYLVGGFGGCHYLCNAIKEQIDRKYKIKYVIPNGPEFAVVRGAVLFHKNPEAVHTRRVDATYGVAINPLFNARIHDIEYKWTDDDGNERCSNIFSTIVEKGDEVYSSQVFQQTFFPAQHRQTSAGVCLYSSLEKDVWYVTGKRPKNSRISQRATVHKIGEFDVKMPILTGDKSRQVDVTFDFSRTEIQVKGYDRTSGNEVKVVLDFLSG